jgi:hypothetical protein
MSEPNNTEDVWIVNGQPVPAEDVLRVFSEGLRAELERRDQELHTDETDSDEGATSGALLAAYLSAHRTMINGSALCAAFAVAERD